MQIVVPSSGLHYLNARVDNNIFICRVVYLREREGEWERRDNEREREETSV